MKKIGFITIGEAPRKDIMKDIEPLLSDQLEILQAGALNNLSMEQIKELAPDEGDTVLVSALQSGASVEMAEEKILGRLQECITNLEDKGAEGIMFLCTVDFGNAFSSRVPVIYPNKLMYAVVQAVCTDGKLNVLVPDAEQIEEAEKQWSRDGLSVKAVHLSPYTNSPEEFKEKIADADFSDAGYIVMDCMGYSAEMKKIAAEVTGKKVILPRTLATEILKEIII